MTPALSLTGADLIRALGEAAESPAADQAVRERAEALAANMAGEGIVTGVLRRGPGDYLVTVAGEGLFAREFGSRAAEASPVVGAAVARAKGRIT